MSSRYKKWFWGALLLANLAVAGAFFFIFFSGRDYSVNQKENAHVIGVSYMTMNNEFYAIMSEEINARIEAEGDKIILRDPALDEERQREQISEMLDAGIDVLVVEKLDKLIDYPRKQKNREYLWWFWIQMCRMRIWLTAPSPRTITRPGGLWENILKNRTTKPEW